MEGGTVQYAEEDNEARVTQVYNKGLDVRVKIDPAK